MPPLPWPSILVPSSETWNPNRGSSRSSGRSLSNQEQVVEGPSGYCTASLTIPCNRRDKILAMRAALALGRAQTWLVAVHPAYDLMCDAFAPEVVRGDGAARSEWAGQQLRLAARASRRLGLSRMGTFSGSFAWPYVFPFPQRPEGLIEAAFDELARRWRPLLDVCDAQGVDLCFEIHPSEDLHDGATFEMLLERVGAHPRCRILFDPSHFVLQQLKYLDFIDIYHERIGMFHVKDAEFNPTGRQGIYGGYQSWVDRAGRFRSLGDGQVDFKSIFSKLTQYDFSGWATLEWECCLKDQDDGAREGAAFIRDHIIPVTDKVFDDFAGAPLERARIDALLGIA